jgi:uncharacterized membrane protein YfcA
MPAGTADQGEIERTNPSSHTGRILLVGMIAGFTSGLFGVGGGIIIVPSLVLLAGFPQKIATGTSLTAIAPIAISGIVGYSIDGEVDFAAAGLVAVGAVYGALIGTKWLRQISAPLLQIIFAVVMILTALKMFFDDPDAAGRSELHFGLIVGLIALGLASGILAGLLGVGGGIIIVPALSMLFGVPHILAKGTSLAVILPTAVSGTIRNRRARLTNLRAAAIVGIAGVATALLASQLSIGLDPKLSQALFAVLLMLVAVRLGITGYREPRTPPVSSPDPA